ncbi:P protein-like isoform X2 [Contarinia nasturtii]|uniref:P protein-like isoform X2 n=1 Tax=Contarinia nasturtii TaxID=265458 RepID=UPI0012D476D4|nr:P protein-like isoform X2 [Contarinia nasturtii]
MSHTNGMCDEALLAWQQFPEAIRNDPILFEYREELQHIQETGASSVQTELLHSKNGKNTETSAQGSVNLIKYIIFAVLWAFMAYQLLTVQEKNLTRYDIVVQPNKTKALNYRSDEIGSKISVNLIGPLTKPTNTSCDSVTIDVLIDDERVTKYFNVERSGSDQTKLDKVEFCLKINSNITQLNLSMQFTTNAQDAVSFHMYVDAHSMDKQIGAICGAIILISLNVLIISEVVHRTLAALLAAFASIGTLAALQDRPSMDDMIKWIDYETLLLIFSMMVMVAILIDTGIFDYIAVYTFQLSRGRIWRLITILCAISAFISMFLDNVTTIMLMTPITIKLFECLGLNPVPVLPFIILNINIAGLTTLIGHPPNLLITGNSYISKQNITFLTFTMHTCFGVVIALIQTNFQLRMQHRSIHEILKPQHTSSLEMEAWQKCLDSIKNNNKLNALIRILENKIATLRRETENITSFDQMSTNSNSKFQSTLRQLKRMYPIKDKILLKKSGATMAFIIALFFIESIPSIQRMTLGWSAFTGVILLLLISDCNLDSVMQRVEWITLIFFGAMFITMECVARMGLIHWIGKQTEELILLVDEEYRLALAIVIVLWVSALTSSVVDSIPVTAMMVKIVVSLAENKALSLPVQPMAYALAFGPTLGGNGSLYGASSNIVCAGLAEKLGHKITFFQYFRIGFPVMIGNVLLVTAYLVIAHVILEWN